MLPTGHVEYTWAALNLVQRYVERRNDLAQDTVCAGSVARGFLVADYRLMALAAVTPDLIDKPLALTLYRDSSAALFWGHNLWLHLTVWLLVWIATRSRHRFPLALPYLLAFSGHLLADRMWGFQESLFYPLGGGYWHPWMHVGEPAAMLEAYLTIIRTTPILVALELLGLLLLGWFVLDRALWQWPRLRSFVKTGRFDARSSDGRSWSLARCREIPAGQKGAPAQPHGMPGHASGVFGRTGRVDG